MSNWDIGENVAGYFYKANSPRAQLLLQHGYGEYAERYIEQYSQLISGQTPPDGQEGSSGRTTNSSLRSLTRGIGNSHQLDSRQSQRCCRDSQLFSNAGSFKALGASTWQDFCSPSPLGTDAPSQTRHGGLDP